jgi:hypothetical protein
MLFVFDVEPNIASILQSFQYSHCRPKMAAYGKAWRWAGIQ